MVGFAPERRLRRVNRRDSSVSMVGFAPERRLRRVNRRDSSGLLPYNCGT
jgi:hypothetical protein